jgi:hypothetical protein
MSNKIEYVCDKETKGTFRFQPIKGEAEPAGQATIYLKKDFVKAAGIDPMKGFVMTLEAK